VIRVSTIKVLAVYWALLAFGITMYTGIRSDSLEMLAPVWLGTFVGTVVGQVLALRNARGWFLLLVTVGGGMLWIPQLPDSMPVDPVWMAYVPATLCAYWALGDRTSLLAFWFPAMIWMLSILDGTSPNAMPDSTGLVLLGTLVLLFVVYLRVREERRIALWRTVAPSPLAVVKPPVLLHEGADGKLPRIAWTVVMSALGFAATMWLAPRMWKAETFDGGHFESASREIQMGVPCCPRHAIAPATRGRLKEYFNLGRSHQKIGEPDHEVGCRVCPSRGGASGVDAPEIKIQREPIAGYYTGGDYEPTFHDPAYVGGTRDGVVVAGTDGTPYVAPAPYVPSPPTRFPMQGEPPMTRPQLPAPRVEPAPHVAPPPHVTPPPRVVPPPPPHVAPPPRVAPAPHVAPVPPPPPPPPPVVAATPPSPVVVPTPPSPAIAPSKLDAPELAGEQPPAIRAPSHNPGVVLRWAAILLGTLLLGQLIALVLRPVRRAIALRHLERPFWDETVDQRVSNAWQLVLIGLRDGGWRTTAYESPVALAKRVDLPGLDRCATILERARHGIGIDHDDLAEMTTSAAGVYRAARTHATPFARTVAWLRWPLA
jgi:hypothetical protein